MNYPSDLTDHDWSIIEPLLPPANHMGRPREVDFRELLNALFYIDRTGCQWRYLPTEFPKWTTVYYYSRKWSLDGTLQRIHEALHRQVRLASGRNPEPSAAIIDSQSVKTSQKGGVKKNQLRQDDRVRRQQEGQGEKTAYPSG